MIQYLFIHHEFHVRFLQRVLKFTKASAMTELSEEGGIMVEDEFSEEVSDQINLQDTGQAEHRTRVLVLKPEEILADPLAEESNSASEKVIHINTR